MPELALDQRQRDPFVQQLHGVSMAELMRGKAPPDTGLERGMAQLAARGGG